ncbi:hypothetical protein FQN49_007284 [Arthroderma sp. PD_2]|nr:hypothetical protein FQN49_007284 [Arthroderma sp. PD_2]
MSLPSEAPISNNTGRSTSIHRSLSERRHENIGRPASGASEDHTTWTQFLREDQSTDGGENSHSGGRGSDGPSTANRKRRLGSGSSADITRHGLGSQASPASGTRSVAIRQHSRPSNPGVRASGNSHTTQPEEHTAESLPAGSPPSPSMSRQLNSLRHRERSFTDHRLPRWQPDSEVTTCPICGVTFTFWFRKHHCRKCGRVVCAACSPHRITIPRQFIVRPPETQRPISTIIQRTAEPEVINLIDDEEEQQPPPSSQPHSQASIASSHHVPRSALGGGAEVRLCNPCVPDPNPEPPRRYRASSSTSHHDHRGRNSNLGWEGHRHRHQGDPRSLPSGHQNTGSWDFSMERSRRQSASISSGSSRTPESYMEGRRQREREFNTAVHNHARETQRAHRASLTEANLPSYGGFGYEVSSSLRGLPPRYFPGREVGSHIHGSPPSYSSPEASTQVSSKHHSYHSLSHPTQLNVKDFQRHHHHASYPRSHPTIRAADMNRPLPPPPIARSQRAVNERDLCPVCNHVLPPQSSSGGENAHEEHIRVCIERHAARRPRPSNQSSESSVRQLSDRLRMLTFNATEKDCVGTDGVHPECTICMEEYEVGVELARLECLCKFHKSCILGWFDRKEECPVHKVA